MITPAGQSVLITGASRGLGYALAAEYPTRGWQVTATPGAGQGGRSSWITKARPSAGSAGG